MPCHWPSHSLQILFIERVHTRSPFPSGSSVATGAGPPQALSASSARLRAAPVSCITMAALMPPACSYSASAAARSSPVAFMVMRIERSRSFTLVAFTSTMRFL